MDKKRRKVYQFYPFSLDITTRRLLRDGKHVPLSVKNFDILLLLVQNQGKLVTKEELMRAVWPDKFVEENNLTVRISALRKALADQPGEHKYIETVPGRGYRFVASVKELEVEGTEEIGVEVVGAAQRVAARERPEANMYLAVLPFVNENADPNTEYLSDGITDNIIDRLSLLPQLKVMARTTTDRYRGRKIDPYSIGRELGVKAVLVGRLLLDGEALVVCAELFRVADRVHLWGARYRRQLTELFFLQEEIAREIAESLQLRLVHKENMESLKKSSANSDAYLCYLKGRYFWSKRSIRGIMRAVEYFQKAIELYPSYAAAHAGLADRYILLTDYGVRSQSETLSKARTAIVSALDIDEQQAEAHVSQAHIKSRYDWDWVGAERAYRRAIELNPSYAQAYQWYAEHLAKMGRFKDALLEVRKAQSIEPLSLSINRVAALILYFTRQYEKAIEQCLQALELDCTFGPVSGTLGLCYVQKQMYQEAINAFQKLICFAQADYQFLAGVNKGARPASLQQISLSESDPESIAVLAYTYAKAADKEKALEILNGLIKLSESRHIEPHAIAIIHMGLGNKDQAFQWLEKSYAEQSYALTYIGVWPLFDDLRTDVRLTDLMRRVGTSA
jgi:DNA-binding winged helix-turn-helix (wHTH) protein